MIHPQHQSREAGSCMGAQRSFSRSNVPPTIIRLLMLQTLHPPWCASRSGGLYPIQPGWFRHAGTPLPFLPHCLSLAFVPRHRAANQRLAEAHAVSASVLLIPCTLPTDKPVMAATLRTEAPGCLRAEIASSTLDCATGWPPSHLPVLVVLVALQRSTPATTRSRMMARSNSANTPHMPKMRSVACWASTSSRKRDTSASFQTSATCDVRRRP
jgi:hypothetical protein